MKIYTEEQVMKAYNMGIDDGHNGAISLKINELSLTPIELPSDEDIYSILRGKKMFEKDWGFIEGAKWMREQILNQNK